MPLPLRTDEPHHLSTGDAASRPQAAIFRHPHAQHEVKLGEVLVAFELKRTHRRSIGMVVGPEGLSVRAPRWVGRGEIERVLRDKALWICGKLAQQRERVHLQQAGRIDWREGADVPVLGEPVRLVLDGGIVGARLDHHVLAPAGAPRQFLRLGLPTLASPEDIRSGVTDWLQEHARQLFAQRVEHFAAQLGVSVSSIRLSSARTRWGSASASGAIRLHWRLIHFSPAVVDYVVVHELAHLVEMNHGPRFWAVVASVLPHFDRAKEQLRRAVIPD